MRDIASIDHLRALPLCVTIRTKTGRTCERIDTGAWCEMGKSEEVSFDEETDFPATVIWSYAEQIGDPATEALAQLALSLLNAQATQQAQQMQAAQAEQDELRRQAEMQQRVGAQFNGEPQVIQPGVPPQVITPQG